MSIETRNKISKYCKEISKDFLNIQGPGGNVSWKEGDDFFIKASGKWIANISDENIFCKLSLKKTKSYFARNVNIKKIDTFTPNLQPSIETYFHAVLPQKFVVHLHHLPTLTMLIKKNCKNYIKSRDDGNFNWIFIEYFKPGFELAKNIDNKLKTGYTPDVIFLQNHGIIFAAEKIENLEKIFNWICNRFGRNIHFNENLIVSNSNNKNVFNFGNRNYDLSVLLTKSDNFTRLKNNWRICPDHIVFLGKDPNIILNNPKKNEKPIHAPFTFDSINNLIIQHNPSVSEIMQLCAYIEVISGLKRNDIVSNLTQAHCEELINWDLEKLRKASNMSTRI